MLKRALSSFAELWRDLLLDLERWYESQVRMQRALAFNAEHTHVSDIKRSRWMCPSCNRVVNAYGLSSFGGLMFPGCCEFEQGGRRDRKHGVDL
jgi:hypothetical protein